MRYTFYCRLSLFHKQFVEPLTSPQSTEYVKKTAQRAATEQVSVVKICIIDVQSCYPQSHHCFSLCRGHPPSLPCPDPRPETYPHTHFYLHPNSQTYPCLRSHRFSLCLHVASSSSFLRHRQRFFLILFLIFIVIVVLFLSILFFLFVILIHSASLSVLSS